jgi:hypothetical protein
MSMSCYQCSVQLEWKYLIQLKRVRHSTKIQCILKKYDLLPKFNINRLSMPCRQCSVQLKWVCMLPRLSTTRMSIQYYHGSKQVECICHVTNTKVECILCLQGYLHFTWEYHVTKVSYISHASTKSPKLRTYQMSITCQESSVHVTWPTHVNMLASPLYTPWITFRIRNTTIPRLQD